MNDPIKSKIIEMVPEIVDRTCRRCANWGCTDHIGSGADSPITLADVLRAISSGYGKWAVDDVGCFWHLNSGEAWIPKEKRIEWNLTTDYDGQTQEVKDFLGELLGV